MSKKKIKKFESFDRDEFYKEESYLRSYPNKTKLDEITLQIKRLNIIDWVFDFKSYGSILIYPSNTFKILIDKYNEMSNDKIILRNNFFLINIDINNFNKIDFEKGLPIELRGLGIAYHIYKKVVSYYHFITTDKDSSQGAHNLWYHLMFDRDLICYTSKTESGIIIKSIEDSKLKILLEHLKSKDLSFDNDLKEKIKEIYGSMDIYKQGN